MLTIARNALTAAALLAASLPAATVRVTITNLAPSNGTFLTPLWVGFHNGTFDPRSPSISISIL